MGMMEFEEASIARCTNSDQSRYIMTPRSHEYNDHVREELPHTIALMMVGNRHCPSYHNNHSRHEFYTFACTREHTRSPLIKLTAKVLCRLSFSVADYRVLRARWPPEDLMGFAQEKQSICAEMGSKDEDNSKQPRIQHGEKERSRASSSGRRSGGGLRVFP